MKHYITVKWLPDITKEQKAAFLPDIKEIFRGALTVAGVHAAEVFANCVDRDNRFDVMIVLDMDKEALPLYDGCESHKEWKRKYGGLIAAKTIFDCDQS